MRALSFSLVASLALAACSSDSGNPSNPAPGGSGGGGSTSLGGAGSPAGGSGGAPAGSGGVAGAAGTGGGLAGAAGASGGMAGACGGGMSGGGAGGNGGTAEYAKPTKLSQTGLYADVSNGTLAPGVLEYRPKYELWSDSAVKRRWVYLPPCSKIDTTGTAPGTERSAPMDFWRYPVGTKLWKEFSRDGVRVETRLIEKYVEYVNGSPRERWFMSAFVWNEALSDADVTVDGVQNARGTMHDVPSQTVCADCHDNMYDRVLGFSAIQLSHTLPGVKLSDLVTSNQLTAAPAAPIVLPGTEAQQNVLGYLHANCGHCHNENSQHSALNMVLWLSTGSLGSLEATPTVATTRNQPAQGPEQPDDDLRIVPGQPAQSELFQRLTIPFGDDLHMPRVGTEMLDQPAITAIEAFITSLPSAP